MTAGLRLTLDINTPHVRGCPRGCQDTYRMFDRQFAQLQHDRTIPCLGASA